VANSFGKEIRIAFDEALEAYQDAMVMVRNVSIYKTDQTEMERAANGIYRPMPYIATTYAGSDMTNNFATQTQLMVPAVIDTRRAATWILSDQEMRDMAQGGELKKAATQRLASDINISISDKAALQGTLTIKRSGAASGFDDVAQMDQIMNEQGVPMMDRVFGISSRDYNGLASNLQVSSRSFDNPKSTRAYEEAYVGRVSGFETFKLDYAYRLQAAAGGSGLTISTLDSGGQYYNPTSSTTSASGFSPTDNRFQTVTVSSTTSVVAGDRFTIAGLNAVHHITKRDTGSLKTFTVSQVLTSTTMVISPPIITNQLGTSDAAAQYQNCIINTKSSTSAIVFLNTVAGPVNPFWQKDSIEILPGKLVMPPGVGADFMQAETDQGIQLTLQRQWDIKTSKLLWRLDAFWGVVVKQPEMVGSIHFSQT
jgi:hypothetical protein